jgi:signal transduction histidine kinase
LGRVLKSVFTKLLAIILVTGLLLNLVLGVFFVVHRLFVSKPFQKTIYHYVNYIIADLGIPPGLERARQVSRDTALQISYQGPTVSWTTDPDPQPFSARRLHAWTEYPNVSSGKIRRHFVVQIDHDLGRFLFKFSTLPGREDHLTGWHLGLLLVVSLILGGAYLMIRKVLKPVARLKEGVRQVGEGNLNHTVSVKGRDELRDLAEAFNEMTGRIKTMLDSKERLLLDVSHELRSPLTRVGVALEFMPDGQAKESIRADLEEMTHMISTILDTARSHHAHSDVRLSAVDLIPLLRESVADVDDQPPGVSVAGLPSELICRLDAPKMAIVFRNILENALKYSSEDSPPVEVKVERQPPFAIVRFHDFGIGIPEAELDAVLEPFYRVDKSRSRRTGGFGLGLSLCKTIMDAHGGKIEISSSPGHGTSVSLSIPLGAAA